MARIVVIGSVARDDVVRLHEGFREGTHLQGAWHGPRLGGGASCTAVPLAHAGHDVVVVGSIGLDDLGEELLAELEATGVDMSQVARIDQPSTRSIILVDGEGERTVINVTRTHQDEPPARLLRLGADCVYVRSRRLDLAPLLREKAGSSLIIAHLPPCLPEGVRPAHILVTSASDVGADVLDDPLEVGRRVAGELLQWVLVTHGAKGVDCLRPGRNAQGAGTEGEAGGHDRRGRYLRRRTGACPGHGQDDDRGPGNQPSSGAPRPPSGKARSCRRKPSNGCFNRALQASSARRSKRLISRARESVQVSSLERI